MWLLRSLKQRRFVHSCLLVHTFTITVCVCAYACARVRMYLFVWLQIGVVPVGMITLLKDCPAYCCSYSSLSLPSFTYAIRFLFWRFQVHGHQQRQKKLLRWQPKTIARRYERRRPHSLFQNLHMYARTS